MRESRRLVANPDRIVKEIRVEPQPGQDAAALALGVPAEGLGYAEEVALFPLADLDELGCRHRLTRVAAAGDYRGGPLVEADSPRWLLVFRREAGDPEGAEYGSGEAQG